MAKNNFLFENILLVDDDHDDCFIFETALKELNPDLHFSCLTNSVQLAEHLAQNSPDLIFLDINMPRKNGFECLLEIKSMAAHKAIPVIMYSNSARPQELEQAYQYGATLYLKKPSGYSDLVEALQEVLGTDLRQPHARAGTYFYKGRYLAANAV
jgi:CheY-like chemotaxis protein